jgi:hypothetical protein
MTFTKYYKEIDRNEPTEFEALVLDGAEAVNDRLVAYCFNMEQAQAINDCFEENVTIEDLGGGYIAIYEAYEKLTGHARNELKEARA